MDTVKVLWRSKHSPKEKHKQLLQALYPDNVLDITHDKSWINEAHHIAEQVKLGQYDELFVNASLEVLNAIAISGIRPLIAVTDDTDEGDHDFMTNHGPKKIVEIRRFKQVIIDHSKPKPFGMFPS